MNSKSVAIIGGGFTGMVAALRLAQAGAKVTLIESAGELGGLAASFEIQGEPLEKAYHHLFRTDGDILKLIHELGLEDRLEWRESSVAIYRDGKLWPFMSPRDLLAFGPSSWIGRLRLGFVALFLKHYKNWSTLASTPALAWMRRYCGASATKAVWEPLLKGKFSTFADQVSMGWLWARLHVRTNSREPNGGGEKLGYIHGGFIRIVSELERRLMDAGVRIELNTRVESIGHDGTQVSIRRMGLRDTFDSAVFTGSNTALARLLPQGQEFDTYRAKLANINYIGAVCMVFESDQKLGDYYWINVNEPEWPFLVMIRHTRLIPADRYQGKEIYYLGAYVPHDDRRFTMTDDELRDSWFEKLKVMFPAFAPEAVSGSHCFRFRDAQHIVGCDYQQHLLPPQTPIRGLHLANFAQIFPYDRGTNFAVREGEKIAALLMRKFGC